ncbi:MAG TPA: GC-type dockerin domain-anchored protein [Phycisphaerales bacterium]|nr:GC-type dockerin domain-anchored protein [Phycisphaerales bacterium]
MIRVQAILGWMVAALLGGVAAGGELLLRIDGSSWHGAGLATSENTGLSAVEPARWTHQALAAGDSWPGDASLRCLTQRDASAPSSLRLDALSGAKAPFVGAGDAPATFVVSAWVRARVVDPRALMALGDAEWELQSCSAAGLPGAVKLRLNNARVPDRIGFTPYLESGSLDDESVLGAGAGYGGIIDASQPVFGAGRWARLSLAMRTGADGWFALSVNGQTVSRRVHLNTTACTREQLNAIWTLTLPAWPGLLFQVGGLESWRGCDWPGFTAWTPAPPSADAAARWPVRFIDGAPGSPWKSSGDAQAQSLPLSAEIGAPWRSRVVVTGEPGQRFSLQTVTGPGRLPFNDDGWATVNLSMLRVSAPGVHWRVSLLNDDLRPAYHLTLKQGSVIAGETTLLIADGDRRVTLNLHLHRSGAARISAADMSEDVLLGSLVPASWSAVVTDWRPGPVAAFRLEAEFDHPGTAECDGLSLHRWLAVALCDSYASAQVPGLEPPHYTPVTDIAGAFSCLGDAPSAGHYDPQPLAEGPGWGIAATLGRPGRPLMAWAEMMLGGWSEARGVRYVLFGGLNNDLALCGTSFPWEQVAARDTSAIVSLASAMPARESRFAWVIPPFGSASGFLAPGARESYDATIAGALQQIGAEPAVAACFTLATTGPTPLTDGVHYTTNADLAAAFVARTWVAAPPAGGPPCNAADIASAGGFPGFDGRNDTNDLVVFIDRFMNGSARADCAGVGAIPVPDGVLDNNDFAVFIDQFFRPCGFP